MASTYEFVKSEGVFCPKCNQLVEFMARKNHKFSWTWFYICWDCRRVFQVGRGEVLREVE